MFKKLESKAWNTIKNVFFCISAWLLSWLSFVEFQSSISCCSPKSDEDEGLKCQHYDSRGSPRLAICCHYCNPQMSLWVISVHINVVSCQLNRWRNFSHGSSEDKIVKQLSRESFFKTYCTFLAVLLCKSIVFCCVFQSLEQFIWTRVEVIKKVLKSEFFFCLWEVIFWGWAHRTEPWWVRQVHVDCISPVGLQRETDTPCLSDQIVISESGKVVN